MYTDVDFGYSFATRGLTLLPKIFHWSSYVRKGDMARDLDAAATTRLQQYIDRIGTHLKDYRNQQSFAIYEFGVLGDSARKSVEPIAALASADPELTKKMQDKLLH